MRFTLAKKYRGLQKGSPEDTKSLFSCWKNRIHFTKIVFSSRRWLTLMTELRRGALIRKRVRGCSSVFSWTNNNFIVMPVPAVCRMFVKWTLPGPWYLHMNLLYLEPTEPCRGSHESPVAYQTNTPIFCCFVQSGLCHFLKEHLSCLFTSFIKL